MRISSLDELAKLTDTQIQLLLKGIEFNDFIILLENVNSSLKKKILNNVSKNVIDIIKDNKLTNYNTKSKFNHEMMDYIILKANSLLPQKIAIASDHAAFPLKEAIKEHYKDIEFIDYGTTSEESMDYPDSGFLGAEAVAKKECDLGIIMCGSGIGMSIVANKVKGIRAALCHSTDFAKLSRKHNNANVLIMPGRFVAKHLAFDIIDAFFSTNFESGRHQKRIDKITKYENKK